MSIFPLSREGRNTLVYLIFGMSGPVLTAIVIWTLYVARTEGWQAVFANLAYIIAASLMIVVIGLSMFVSIRSIKVSKDGLEASGGEKDA